MVVRKRRWKVVYSTGTRSVRRNGQISPSRYLRVFCPSRDSHSLVGKFGVTRSPEIGRRSSRRLGVCEWKVPTKVRETPSGTGGRSTTSTDEGGTRSLHYLQTLIGSVNANAPSNSWVFGSSAPFPFLHTISFSHPARKGLQSLNSLIPALKHRPGHAYR